MQTFQRGDPVRFFVTKPPRTSDGYQGVVLGYEHEKWLYVQSRGQVYRVHIGDVVRDILPTEDNRPVDPVVEEFLWRTKNFV